MITIVGHGAPIDPLNTTTLKKVMSAALVKVRPADRMVLFEEQDWHA